MYFLVCQYSHQGPNLRIDWTLRLPLAYLCRKERGRLQNYALWKHAYAPLFHGEWKIKGIIMTVLSTCKSKSYNKQIAFPLFPLHLFFVKKRTFFAISFVGEKTKMHGILAPLHFFIFPIFLFREGGTFPLLFLHWRTTLMVNEAPVLLFFFLFLMAWW